ncbi:imm11 family protein [Paenibacillus sp. V4I9]|uniref:imm11 family protein n=1 Tax=Paenibacillus sp. V4I9 TaxID=3042308 RepID=UPI003593D032
MILANSGDILPLPLNYTDKQYYVLRVTNILDSIDYEHSELEILSTGLTVGFKKYGFIPEKLNNQYIFKVFINERIYSTVTFVTDDFKDKVR